MDKQILNGGPEKFTDKYFFYFGTDTIEEMNENIEKLGLNKAKCYFIKLNNQFYAVFFENFDKEVIVGRDKVFYTKNGRLTEDTIGNANIGFNITSRNVKFFTETLAAELNYLYNPIEIYEYPNIKSKEYRLVDKDIRLSNYVVILGVSFASRYYTLSDTEQMLKYFVHTPELMSFLRRTKGAISIDPFSQLIKFEDDRVAPYSYKRVLQSTYNGKNRYSQYGNAEYKTIFALQEKNLYSPFRRREWSSITRYQSMYPNDDIFYPVPDYRVGEAICKWCGKPLPEGKKSYCSVECRLEFGKVVNLERGALLPYLILCRDKFVCQTCGKDMALINKHDMKIPIARVSETPDKDGVCRSEAEVHHIIPIEDNGTDHQSNLSTRCQHCHKQEHKKKSAKTERKLIELKDYRK